jgi:hypothetical protein
VLQVFDFDRAMKHPDARRLLVSGAEMDVLLAADVKGVYGLAPGETAWVTFR